mgnify:CR=1 FL=1
MKIYQANNTINLFWTGGWDSTFRLLQLLLVDKNHVQPYYIMDLKRESMHAELKNMKEIRSILYSNYPYTKELFRPTIFTKVRDIEKDPVITNALKTAIKTTHYGSQYDWLARFCKQNNILDMEMCAQRIANPQTAPRLKPFLIKIDGTQIYKYNVVYANSPEYELFRFYNFPIVEISKLDMLKISNKNGWENMMTKTWFCHHPKLGNKPCGKCTPCKQAISEYLEFRIPLSTGLLSKFEETKFYIFISRVNNYLKNIVHYIKDSTENTPISGK